ncbi:MAG: HDOD domain-containing protein [Porticoccaceae bacterium]|nr:HDOD domain-containing protein [Porticoccaceae bacterium]
MDSHPLSDRLEEIIRQGTLELPLLPAVANQVMQLTLDPESSSEQLAELLQRDQALAGHAMRIANSAAYSPINKLESLQQAITRLGMRTLSEIALASTLSAKLFKVPGYEWRAIEIWKHSLATALWSKEIARVTRRNADATFLAGLLHSIGRPVVLQAALKLIADMGVEPMPNVVTQLEDRYQQQVGLRVCQEWQMPTLVIETLNYLDNPEESKRNSDPIAVIHAATLFAQHTLDPEVMDGEQLQNHAGVQALALSAEQFDGLLDKAEGLENTLATIAG